MYRCAHDIKGIIFLYTMDSEHSMKRSVSFQLKPDVQLFINKTPHSSPMMDSLNPNIEMEKLNLELESISQSMNKMTLDEDIDKAMKNDNELMPLNLKKPYTDMTEEEYAAITISPRSAALGPTPLSPNTVNQIINMRQQEQNHIKQALSEATVVESPASVFIDIYQKSPVLVRFPTLREAWQFGLAYLYNNTENAHNLFPLKECIHIKTIANIWVTTNTDIYSTAPFPTAYKLGSTSLFSVTLFKGHNLPKKTIHTFNTGLVISDPVKAIQHGPYIDFIKGTYVNIYSSEITVYNFYDEPSFKNGWYFELKQSVQTFLKQNGIYI